jgi:hypothetical protein
MDSSDKAGVQFPDSEIYFCSLRTAQYLLVRDVALVRHEKQVIVLLLVIPIAIQLEINPRLHY